ncbi:FAD-dependent monooxygenase [Streptomyces sp. GKU 257-1]|nr:FAD-dependent monooxygenase [Streptomyces sp. GKU 257-1]
MRELLGVAFTGSALPTPFILAEGPLTGVRVPDVPSYFLTSRGGMVIAPLPEGRYRVAGSAVEGQEATAGFIQDILDTRGPGGLRMDDIETLTTFSSSERIATRMRSGGRVLLVGDAAHTHSAVGGQGLNLGLQDVRNLSWKLAGVLGGTLDEAVLDTYEPERLAAARQIVKVTGDVTRVVALARPPWSGLRNAVLRIAERTPSAQSRYAATVAGQRIRYPTSALGRPAGFRRTGLPAPGWAAAATTAGDRFTLLTCGPSDGPLSIAAEALTRRYPALLSHHQLPRRHGEFLLIRPDGYVAVRGRPKDLPRAERLLTAIGSDPQPTERTAMPHRGRTTIRPTKRTRPPFASGPTRSWMAMWRRTPPAGPPTRWRKTSPWAWKPAVYATSGRQRRAGSRRSSTRRSPCSRSWRATGTPPSCGSCRPRPRARSPN